MFEYGSANWRVSHPLAASHTDNSMQSVALLAVRNMEGRFHGKIDNCAENGHGGLARWQILPCRVWRPVCCRRSKAAPLFAAFPMSRA